jgi:hypothetical protein
MDRDGLIGLIYDWEETIWTRRWEEGRKGGREEEESHQWYVGHLLRGIEGGVLGGLGEKILQQTHVDCDQKGLLRVQSAKYDGSKEREGLHTPG